MYLLEISHSLRWRHDGLDGISNHQPHHCLLNRLLGWTSKKTSKLRVTGLCAGNSPVTGEFPAQMASNAESVSIWWCHHGLGVLPDFQYSANRLLRKRLPKFFCRTSSFTCPGAPGSGIFWALNIQGYFGPWIIASFIMFNARHPITHPIAHLQSLLPGITLESCSLGPAHVSWLNSLRPSDAI